MYLPIIGRGLLALTVVFFWGCAYVRSNATSGLAANLKDAVMNYDDLETVETGGPAYLLMIDGLILDDPGNEKLLTSGAALYSAYTGVFVADSARARRLMEAPSGSARKGSASSGIGFSISRIGND